MFHIVYVFVILKKRTKSDRSLPTSLERPVFNDSEAINLTFGLTLQQIIDVVSHPPLHHHHKHLTLLQITDVVSHHFHPLALSSETPLLILHTFFSSYSSIIFVIMFLSIISSSSSNSPP